MVLPSGLHVLSMCAPGAAIPIGRTTIIGAGSSAGAGIQTELKEILKLYFFENIALHRRNFSCCLTSSHDVASINQPGLSL